MVRKPEWSQEEEDSTYDDLRPSVVKIFGEDQVRRWEDEDDGEHSEVP